MLVKLVSIINVRFKEATPTLAGQFLLEVAGNSLYDSVMGTDKNRWFSDPTRRRRTSNNKCYKMIRDIQIITQHLYLLTLSTVY